MDSGVNMACPPKSKKPHLAAGMLSAAVERFSMAVKIGAEQSF